MFVASASYHRKKQNSRAKYTKYFSESAGFFVLILVFFDKPAGLGYTRCRKEVSRMPMSAKTVRNQLEHLQPLLAASSIESQRKGQEMLGAIMGLHLRRQVVVKEHPFANFSGAWVIPKDERRQGVILYLHGGGYVCGGVGDAKGVGSALADWTGSRGFCCA